MRPGNISAARRFHAHPVCDISQRFTSTQKEKEFVRVVWSIMLFWHGSLWGNRGGTACRKHPCSDYVLLG
jgi:hypothetical protein